MSPKSAAAFLALISRCYFQNQNLGKHTYTKKIIFPASYSELAVKLFAQNFLYRLHFKAVPLIASLKSFVGTNNTEFTAVKLGGIKLSNSTFITNP